MKTSLVPLLLAVVAVALTGCTSDRLLFATHTSLGLDVSGTASYPNKVSLSYTRYEAAIVPRKTDDSNDSHSVFGGLDSDVKFALPPKMRVEQVFATGDAAVLAAKDQGDAKTMLSELQNNAKGRDGKGAGQGGGTTDKNLAPLVFITGTTLGVHFSAGEQELNPEALIGYRRREVTMIPIADSSREVRSVYADIHISSQEAEASEEIESDPKEAKAIADERRISQWGGMRIKQSFGTGRAADVLAGSDTNARARLQEAAGVSDSEAVKELKKRGAELGKGVGSQIDALPAEKLEAAGKAALKTGVLRGTIEEFNQQSEDEKRRLLKSATDRPAAGRSQDRVKEFEKLLKAL